MKRKLLVFLLLAWPASAIQTSAQGADGAKGPATAAAPFSQSPEANELFLQAREYYGKSDPRTGGRLAHAREAIRLYEQAVKKDPQFALAYLELSRAWLRLG